MGKQRQTITVIGEGETEFYYFESLRDVYRGLKIKPDYPKHSTSIVDIEKKIVESIEEGYSKIFCVVDMDNKEGKVKEQYENLKRRYEGVSSKKKMPCYEVRFFETHRCTELFFLYYFKYTSRKFENQESLIDEINKICKYEKTETFFKKCKGLHSYFEKQGGLLFNAVKNADRTLEEQKCDGRTYTFSQLGQMIAELERMKTSI